ncbi:MAG: membrane protein insertion efficiency factor YidD [Parachlamydiales bacterium]|nr:membrane protein insertion efficiency factor YidD [Parachlamydiales bacterium]
MRYLLIAMTYIYRMTISPLIGNCCRFYPSCSEYAMGAWKKWGVFKGSFLVLKRLVKCHPWHPGGVDEVP